jgi:4-alpha-glucanotransferase
VPPDYFSRTGQLWGNPIYNWDRMRESGFQWWIERVRSTLESVDIIRLDHFRGFAGCWEIPGGNETAEHGEWVNSPGEEIFSAIRHELGELPLIAEDLGVITPDVEKLRDDFAFPGMRVLQFAFTSDNSNEHLPHNFVPNLVVYTATHDNDTTVGWYNYEKEGSDWNSSALERERTYCNRYLNSNGHEIHWDLIRCAYSSVADLAIIPLQDILGLGTQARMNHPSTATNNWGWRYRKDALTPQISERLKSLAELFGR